MKTALRDCRVFKNLDDRDFSVIERSLRKMRVNKGERLFREGDRGDGFFIITRGAVRITKLMPGGHELILAVLGPGEAFGEMSIITGARRSGECTATEDTELFKLSVDVFSELSSTEPIIYTTILKNMGILLSDRLGRMTDEVVSLLAELDSTEDDVSALERQVEKSRRGISGFLRRLARG